SGGAAVARCDSTGVYCVSDCTIAMNCLLTTGEVCVLQQSPRSDLFEVHITVDAQSDTDTFRAVCQAQRWKSIVIELADDARSQPMTCTRIKGDLPAAFAHAAQVR